MRANPRCNVVALALVATALGQSVPPAAKQNPSPMVDSTRRHARVLKAERSGRRIPLSMGTLFVPEGAQGRSRVSLIVHFHGAGWLAEQSAARFDHNAPVLSIHLGAGSGVYSLAFASPDRYRNLLAEASHAVSPAADLQFSYIVLSAFSAGYGAIREILKDPDNWARIDGIVLADGLHTGYLPEGTPGVLDTEPLRPFMEFAKEATAKRKQMVITHSEIFPGTFASTTECTDYLIAAMRLHQIPVLRWGPAGMQQVSEVASGHLHILGFAGNSAPDHIDHLYGLARWFEILKH